MKRILYIAAALLAVAACSREQGVPDEFNPGSETEPDGGLVSVTLVAGSPETRTELGTVSDKPYPFWSAGDNIWVLPARAENVPHDENDNPIYPATLFESGLTAASPSASFTGDIEAGRTYLAFYPDREVLDEYYDVVTEGVFVGYDEDNNSPFLSYSIPMKQYPTRNSFDKRADFLVSEPFTVDSDDITDGKATVDDVCFTRVNAIVKVVLHDMTTGKRLSGQVVKRVVLGDYWEMEGDIDYAPAPLAKTRAEYYGPEEEQYWGLAGSVYATIGANGECEYYFWGDYGIAAIYTDGTDDTENTQYAFDEDGLHTTYFITVPCVVKNRVEGYDEDVSGLHINVETDDMIIDRNVILPDEGIGLQPSRITTLNIGLYDDGVKETTILENGISFVHWDEEENQEVSFSELSIRENEFEEFTIRLVGITLDSVDDLEWSCDPEGVARVDFDDADYYEDNLYGVRIWGEQASSSPASITFSAGDYSSSLTVNVSEASPIVNIADANALAICVYRWDRNGDEQISEAELAAVTSLNGAFNNYEWNNYNSAQKGAMESFDEFVYFTGLQTLEDYAFAQCHNLQSIVLPPQLSAIGKFAFYNCNLGSIALPAGISTIEESTFENCSNLTTVTLADNATITSIGESAFEAAGLTNIDHLLANATEVGMHAFKDCKFTSVTLQPNAIYGMGMLMQSSLESVVLPSTMTVIPDQFFQSCHALTSVTFPATPVLTEIGESAFSGCEHLDIEALPSSLRTIGKEAFYNCEALSSLTSLPANLTELGDEAFVCTGLTEISIPTGITSLGEGMFYGCEALAEVTLPSTLTALGANVFWGCKSLDGIDIPSSVSSFGSSCFYGCSALTSIDIPSTATSIGEGCFYGCTLLDNVTLPSGLTGPMPSSVFGGCSSLQSMVIPQGITQIGSDLFSGCTSLSSVTIQGSITNVGSNAFSGCSALTTLSIPGQLSSIGYSAFEGCSSLLSITFDFDENAPYKYILDRAFYGCTSLQSIYIPDCLDYIHRSTFFNCSSLQSVHLPSQLTTIDAYAFENCSSLHSIEFPATLNELQNAFYGVTFRSGNGETGVKFNGSTPPTKVYSVFNGEHWDGSGWVSGVEICVPSGSESAYLGIANILNTNNIIVGF